jgi:hypothetical protein
LGEAISNVRIKEESEPSVLVWAKQSFGLNVSKQTIAIANTMMEDIFGFRIVGTRANVVDWGF